MNFESYAKKKLQKEYWDALVWADITSAFSALDSNQRTKFVEAIKTRRDVNIAKAMLKVIDQLVVSKAATAYQDIISDGNLSSDEVNRLFD